MTDTMFSVGDTVLFDMIECVVTRVWHDRGVEMIEFMSTEDDPVFPKGAVLIRTADTFAI